MKSIAALGGRIPITIGITGHRKIHAGALDHIAEQLNQLFSKLKRQFPESPLILISPLAEGSDQLVATIALAQGIDICAVLPMDEDEYRKDFDTEAVNQSFGDLLDQAAYRKTLDKFDPISQRDLCYAYVGKWVIDHSDIAVALWDGDLQTLTGGTGQVVNYALSGEFACLEVQFDSSDWIALPRTVVHISTPRASNAEPVLEQDIVVYRDRAELLAANNEHRQIFDKAVEKLQDLDKINRFNSVVAQNSDSAGYPLLDHNIEDLPDHLAYVHELYLNSDRVANEHQSTFKRYTILFYALTSASMITLLLYFRVFPIAVVLALYMLTYLSTIVVSIRIKNSDFQRTYHLYRSISEIARLFFFFGLSEIRHTKRPSVLNNHREFQYITRKLGIDNQWVLDALRKINLFDDVDPDSSAFDEPLELVRVHWIQDQYGYFEKALRRDMRKLRVQGRLSVFLFAGSFLSGVALFGIEYLNVSIPALVAPLLGAAVGISAGLGGILKTYAYTMGTSELTGRYRLMNELFGNAANRIGSDESNKDAVFEQLWWEALMENIEWFSLKDSRLIKTLNIKKVVQGLVKLTK